MARTTVGYFHDRGSADAAFDDLVKNGFSRDAISIMGRVARAARGWLMTTTRAPARAKGRRLAASRACCSARRRCSSPGIGPIVAVGPLAAGLAGAVTGGVTGAVVGGIVGGLEEAGVPHEDARYYDERFQKGGYLLTVRADDMEYDKARMIMERHDGDVRAGNASGATAATAATGTRTAAGWDTAMPGYRSRWEQRHGKSGERWEDFEPAYRYGYEMHANPTFRGRSWSQAEPELRRDSETRYRDRPWDRFGSHVRDTWDDDEQSMQLKEERLRAEKETVKAGEVALRKQVVTEQKSMDVPVPAPGGCRRAPAGWRAGPATGDIREGETIRAPWTDEQVRLEKQASSPKR